MGPLNWHIGNTARYMQHPACAAPRSRVRAAQLPTCGLTCVSCTWAASSRCMEAFPEDGRPYVSLGKLMVEQRRYNEALALYEEGCTATGACLE